ERIGCRCPVPGFNKGGDRLLEPWKITVIGRHNQRVECEIFSVLQNSDCMQAARRLNSRINISRIVGFLGAGWTSRRPGPVVAVIEPAARRIQQFWRLIYREQALPFGCRITAFYRPGPVKFWIALWNKVPMEIGNIA